MKSKVATFFRETNVCTDLSMKLLANPLLSLSRKMRGLLPALGPPLLNESCDILCPPSLPSPFHICTAYSFVSRCGESPLFPDNAGGRAHKRGHGRTSSSVLGKWYFLKSPQFYEDFAIRQEPSSSIPVDGQFDQEGEEKATSLKIFLKVDFGIRPVMDTHSPTKIVDSSFGRPQKGPNIEQKAFMLSFLLFLIPLMAVIFFPPLPQFGALLTWQQGGGGGKG